MVGAGLAAHAAQKLFGRFGGHGPQGTAAYFREVGCCSPLAMAVMAGVAEFGGGTLLAVGLVTPLAAFAIAAVMLNAIAGRPPEEGSGTRMAATS